jgi:methylglutaconyl-CoA hydratase
MSNPIADPLVEGLDSDATSDLVRLDTTQEGVAVVTLNRPDARNSFNAELIGALHETFETLQAAEGVRVVFLRGAGKVFSAGADLNWMRDAAHWTEAENRDDAMGLARMLKSLWDLPSPWPWSRAAPGAGGAAWPRPATSPWPSGGRSSAFPRPGWA